MNQGPFFFFVVVVVVVVVLVIVLVSLVFLLLFIILIVVGAQVGSVPYTCITHHALVTTGRNRPGITSGRRMRDGMILESLCHVHAKFDPICSP